MKKISDSLAQLAKDFGNYPPNPLCTNSHTFKFKTIDIPRWATRFYYFKMTMKWLFKGVPDYDFSDTEGLVQTKNNLTHIKTTVSDFWKKFQDLNVIKQCGIGLFFILVFPFLLIFCLFFSIFYLGKIRTNSQALAFFLPQENTYEIVIHTKAINTCGRSIEALISHEHLHILQFRDERRVHCEAVKHRVTANLPLLLLEEHYNKPHYIYLFNRHETEARLHELVRSFYIEKNSLPEDLASFTSMLASCHKDINDLLNQPICQKVFWDGEESCSKILEMRCKATAEDISNILFFIKDDYLLVKYIKEVLFTMYGNLVRYYGDKDYSMKIMNLIEGPNLYSSLYPYK